jgi:hypothetical protein
VRRLDPKSNPLTENRADVTEQFEQQFEKLVANLNPDSLWRELTEDGGKVIEAMCARYKRRQQEVEAAHRKQEKQDSALASALRRIEPYLRELHRAGWSDCQPGDADLLSRQIEQPMRQLLGARSALLISTKGKQGRPWKMLSKKDSNSFAPKLFYEVRKRLSLTLTR